MSSLNNSRTDCKLQPDAAAFRLIQTLKNGVSPSDLRLLSQILNYTDVKTLESDISALWNFYISCIDHSQPDA